MSLFLIYKNPLYSILCIGLVVFLIIALIKEKLNYRNSFLKKLKRKEESMRWTSGIMQVGGHAAKPSSSNKKPWMFPRSKSFREEKGISYC